MKLDWESSCHSFGIRTVSGVANKSVKATGRHPSAPGTTFARAAWLQIAYLHISCLACSSLSNLLLPVLETLTIS